VGLCHGFGALYSSGDTLDFFAGEWCNGSIDERGLELGEHRGYFVRCLFRDLIESISCDDHRQHQLQSSEFEQQYDVLLEDRSKE
jgi:hypothetical protein